MVLCLNMRIVQRTDGRNQPRSNFKTVRRQSSLKLPRVTLGRRSFFHFHLLYFVTRREDSEKKAPRSRSLGVTRRMLRR